MKQDNRFRTRLVVLLVIWVLGWLWFAWADYFVPLFTWPDGAPGGKCAENVGNDPSAIEACRKLVGTAEHYYWGMQAVKDRARYYLASMISVPLVIFLLWRAKRWIYD